MKWDWKYGPHPNQTNMVGWIQQLIQVVHLGIR